MSKFITLSHPDLEESARSFLALDSQPGAQKITLKNTAGFTQGDYILLGKYGQEQAEIVPIVAPITSNTELSIGAPKFGHPADSEVSKMEFNQFKIYRSVTGLGGFYTLLDTRPLQVDSYKNVYEDTASIAPYSYRFTYYNDAKLIETDFSDQIPFEGFPFYCLGKLQNRVIDLWGDPREDFISREMITDWINECLEAMQFEVMGGDSPRFLDSITLPVTSLANTLDITNYNMLDIVLVEYSNNGATFSQRIDAADFRNGQSNSVGTYTLAGNIFTLRGMVGTGFVKIWFLKDATKLEGDSDVLPDPFRGHTRVFVNWALMRAHEKDRKILDLGGYYLKSLERERLDVIRRLKSRIENTKMDTPFENSFENFFN